MPNPNQTPDPIVSALVVELWRGTEPPPGVPRTTEQRFLLVEAGVPDLILRASMLRAVAASVEAQSTEQALRERAADGDTKRAMVDARIGKDAPVASHVREMERNIAARDRSERLAKVQAVADECAAKVRQSEAALAARRSSTNGPAADPSLELDLARAKREYAAALDAVAAIRAERI